MTSRRRTRPVGLLAAAVIVGALVAPSGVRGQSSPAPRAADAATASPLPAATAPAVPVPADVKPTSAGVVQLKGPDGQAVPVPADATLEEFLEWKRRQQQADQVQVPEAIVTSIELEGTADDDRVLARAVIKVQINRANAWVKLPLSLPEAILDGTEYKGAGQASFAGFERETGYRWWFRGLGEHELVLSLVIPIRKQSPGRRLQLSMPSTAVSRMRLRVPQPRISAKVLPETAWTRTTSAEGDASQIEIRGLVPRLDVTWQPLPNPQAVETVLQAETLISADITGESVLLEAEQSVEALQGSMAEFVVRLPPGFSLLDVEERQGKLYSGHAVDPQDPTRVTVRLNESSVGPVRLKWTLEADLSDSDGSVPVTVEGFSVERATRQTGEIAVFAAEGFRVTRREADERLIYRTNTTRIPRAGRLAGAYRFLKQPFRLALDVAAIKPYYSVDADYELRFTAGQLQLAGTLTFDVDPDRGALQEFVLDWPNRLGEGWVVDPLESRGLVEQVLPGEGPQADTLRVRLALRKTGTIELPIRARRPIPSAGQAFALTLPTVAGAVRQETDVAVVSDPNLEPILTAAAGTLLRTVSRGDPSTNEPAPSPAQYRIDSEAHTLTARVVAHSQSVRTRCLVDVDVQGDRLLVTQRILYTVAWEPLAQVRLLVPAELEGQVQFLQGDSTTLLPTWTRLELESLKQARLTLLESQLGTVEIVARFARELPAESSERIEIDLPLVQPADAEPDSVRVVVRNSNGGDLLVADPAWELQPTLDGTREWMARGARPAIPLSLTRATSPPSDAYSISKALVRTAVDADGSSRSRGTYRLDRPVATVAVAFPPEITPEAFWWNSVRLDGQRIRESSPGSGRYELTIPESQHEDALLTIDFHAKQGEPFRLAQAQKLYAPRFPANVWVEQTVWELVLPFNQHLFTSPRGFVPQFRWQRSGLLWWRFARAPFEQPANWIDADQGPPERPELASGNLYPFSRFGPAGSIAFSSMSRSLIVLLGAGSALLAAFVLLNIPASRSLLTLLTAAFATAVVSLWYAEAVQLLLQPAILGIVLAVVAALIQNALQRDATPAVLTISPASDVIAPAQASSIEQFAAAGMVGSDDPTAIRALPPRRSEPLSSSAAGAVR